MISCKKRRSMSKELEKHDSVRWAFTSKSKIYISNLKDIVLQFGNPSWHVQKQISFACEADSVASRWSLLYADSTWDVCHSVRVPRSSIEICWLLWAHCLRLRDESHAMGKIDFWTGNHMRQCMHRPLHLAWDKVRSWCIMRRVINFLM